MDNLQLHIKVAILSGQVMASNARAEQLQRAAQLMLDDMRELRETVNGLLREFPSDSHIEGLVRECNSTERSLWIDYIEAGRELKQELEVLRG